LDTLYDNSDHCVVLHVRRNRTENTGEFRFWGPFPHCVWVFDYFQDNLPMQNGFNIFVD